MPFPFRYICDLLQSLEDKVPKSRSQKAPSKRRSNAIISDWFTHHREQLDHGDVDACAILSTLLPKRRTDRVYNIQVSRLEGMFEKAHVLGVSRRKELRRYTTPGLCLDLADCVESILMGTPNSIDDKTVITVDEIDRVLDGVAADCRFSSPAIKAMTRDHISQPKEALMKLYRALTPRDAKWFTRLVLKNYAPIEVDDFHVLRCYHRLLPLLMKVRDSLPVVTGYLSHIDQSPDPAAVTALPRPVLGTKVGRQFWAKGRSIKHCLDMGQRRLMSCEQKLDGEYCQIHVDLSSSTKQITIFSKSGKDSTEDRQGVHRAIQESLRLGTPDCDLKTGCILEGELLVYSLKDRQILPFHKIRKHVSRSGTYIGTKADSQRHYYEQLMIVYYDVLMVDNESLLGLRHSERFKRLESIISCTVGSAELVQRSAISFADNNAASQLREAFARCIRAREEGLVLKPDAPYFDFSPGQIPYASCNIKVKKEYFQGWSEVGDFAVVGASYDAAKARTFSIPILNWTHFYIGCLQNRERARCGLETPKFMVTNVIELSEEHLKTVNRACCPDYIPFQENNALELDFGGVGMVKKPIFVFRIPLVFDMRSFSFDKESGSRTWSMRFPTVAKIHSDRSYLDTISFDELQEIAQTATEAPVMEDSQELRAWIQALEETEPGRRRGSGEVTSTANCRRPPALTKANTEPGRPKRLNDAELDLAASGKRRRTALDSGINPPSLTAPPKLFARHQTDGSASATTKPSLLAHSFHATTHPSSPHQPPASPSNEQPKQTPQTSNPPQDPQNTTPNNPTTPTECRHRGIRCELANYSLLLSPCISNYAWLTENLLRDHGITDFATEPESWGPAFTAMVPGSGERDREMAASSSRRREKTRLCLVDSRRPVQTAAFLDHIGRAGLRRGKDGARLWVRVVDWRLVEDLADLEKSGRDAGDVWTARYVGFA